MPTALAASLLRAWQSTSSYTVPHYNHTGTHTTYMHWSTSGNALGKWWDSSGMHPFSRGPYNFPVHATGIQGEAMCTERRGDVGLGLWPSHSWRRTRQYNNNPYPLPLPSPPLSPPASCGGWIRLQSVAYLNSNSGAVTSHFVWMKYEKRLKETI